jgi:acyl-CoA thioesterase-1
LTRYGPRRAGVNIAGFCSALLLLLFLAAPAAAAPLRILAFGDSLTAGYGLAESEAFPARLQAALAKAGVEAEIINGGVSGDTTAGGLARLDWSLADRPDLVLLELGANDGLRGIDPKDTEANLDAILTRLAQDGIPVLFAGMLAPPNLGPEFGAEYNALFPRLAERHKVTFYPFFLDGVARVPDLNQSDGLHPTAAGVDVIVERILPALLKVIEQIRPASSVAG